LGCGSPKIKKDFFWGWWILKNKKYILWVVDKGDIIGRYLL
jgi:hypothetical protein